MMKVSMSFSVHTVQEQSGPWMPNLLLLVCSYDTSDNDILYFQQTKRKKAQRLEHLQPNVSVGKTGQTPFNIMAQGKVGGSRKQADRFDNKVFREYLACFLINTNASLSVVENSRFRQLLQYCNPSTTPDVQKSRDQA